MILITGASGFLGKYLMNEFLSEGYEVRALVRNASSREFAWSKMAEIVEGDVLDVLSLEKAMEGVSGVIHAAAMVSFHPKRREEMLQANVVGTANVVDACLAHGEARLLHVSSVAAIGREGNDTISEETKWKTSKLNSAYALSKRKAELEVQRGVVEGVEACMINPGLILGAGDWQHGSSKIFTIVNRGLRFYNAGVNGAVGAADVARASRMLYESDYKAGERFIAVAQNLNQQELFGMVARHLGKNPPTIHMPPILAKMAGLASQMIAGITGTEPVISRETIRTSLNKFYYDGSKLQEQLGFSYTDLDQVIAEAAQQFKVDQN